MPRGGWNRLSTEVEDRIIALYYENKTYKDIAAEVGVGVVSVSNVLDRRLGSPRRRNPGPQRH